MQLDLDLIIGDIHLDGRDKNVLSAQVDTIVKICEEVCSTHSIIVNIIFLGDIFNYRKPSPSELIAFKTLIYRIKPLLPIFGDIIILRGNHDTETKDGSNLTALTLYNSDFVYVYDEYSMDAQYAYIPHYEEEQKIVDVLKEIETKDVTILGHFGTKGALNSRGDEDFNIDSSHIKNKTILGHIHKFKQVGSITFLGTPYTTNFGEAGKDSFVLVYNKTTKEEKFIPVTQGIRHLVIDSDNLEANLDFINDNNYKTILKINVTNPILFDGFSDIVNKLNVISYIVNFEPKVDPAEVISLNIDNVKDINNELIEEYIQASNVSLDKLTLLNGLQEIYANKQNKNS